MFKFRLVFFGLSIITQSVISQVLHDPQHFYDEPGGLFDHDSLRTIDIGFYEPNYHQLLVEGW